MKRRKLSMIFVSLLLCQTLCLAGLLTIGGSSMEPAIKNGQKVWVSGYPKGTDPARGDIIAFKVEKQLNLKRVVGLPGETVVIREGIVYITNQANPQGERLAEAYLAPGTLTAPDGEFPVPAGQYFVLGDNRGASRDSRVLGCIPRENVTGRVTKIY